MTDDRRRPTSLLVGALVVVGGLLGAGSPVDAESPDEPEPTTTVEEEPAPPSTDDAGDVADEPAAVEEELEPAEVPIWQWVLAGLFVTAAIIYMVLRNSGRSDDDDPDVVTTPIDTAPVDASPPDRSRQAPAEPDDGTPAGGTPTQRPD